MKIASSQVDLAARHQTTTEQSRRERLLAWVGERPNVEAAGRPVPAAAPTPAPAPPPPARAGASGADGAGGPPDPDAVETDRRFLDLIILIRAMGADAATARRIAHGARDIRDAHARTPPAAGPSPAAPPPAPAGAAPAGWGLEYERHTETRVTEATHFQAQGLVTTQDGRAIAIDARLDMQHVEVSRTDLTVRAGDARKVDPLVLSRDGAPPTFDGRQTFDLDADGHTEDIARLGGGAAYLALDRNGNGRIDDGGELFGPRTGDGFGELGALDQDGNGWIDEADPAFARLRLWHPGSNSDSAGALVSLAAAGVGAIGVASASTPFTLRDGSGAAQALVSRTGIYLEEDGGAGIVQHIDVVT